ncbi:hypothetical protein [Rhodococcus rhodochrous]|uniref:Uncharacterized protein n=1 Tax=Rhodococcus rhodochrous TaxID=1829 RepID=A0AA46X3C1_RHORH|nr:hypothetical protein [Rhodococcus rhodochrous]UZF48512.1 hypothetical protein KUM34_029525 [Rhodococcus rhodochrous]
MICAALVGAWLASLYDVLRVGVLDNVLANRLGYIGEITSASIDPAPHGITRIGLIIMFLIGLIGGLITYAAAAVSRRSVSDPEAIAYALGTASFGVASGFVWLSTGWPTVEHSPENGFAAFIGYGNIWVPLFMVGISALCLFVWWIHPETDEDETPRGSSSPQVEESS